MKVQTDDGEEIVQILPIGRQQYRSLADAHPPAEGDDTPWNDITFPPALIAACTGWSMMTSRRAWNQWPTGDAENLFIECLRESAPGPLTWAHDLLRRNGRRSLEVKASMQMGIPTSVFLAWPKDDQDLVLAALEADANRCECGVNIDEGRKIGKYKVGYRRCEVCKIRHDANEDIASEERSYVHVELLPIVQD